MSVEKMDFIPSEVLINPTDNIYCAKTLACFKHSVKRNHTYAKILWSNHSWLRDFYYGKMVNIGTVDNVILHCNTITEQLALLRELMVSRCVSIAKEVWTNHQALIEKFTAKGLCHDEIDNEELLLNFKAVLSCQNNFFLTQIWQDNPYLQNMVFTLEKKMAIELFTKVLNLMRCSPIFVKDYINRVETIELIQTALHDLKKSFYAAQISSLLQKRLNDLLLVERMFSSPNNSPTFYRANSPKPKKDSIEIEDIFSFQEIDNLKWLTELFRNTSFELPHDKLRFFIDNKLGRALEILSPEFTEKNIGIRIANKVPGTTYYLALVTNLPRYNQFLLKYIDSSSNFSPMSISKP